MIVQSLGRVQKGEKKGDYRRKGFTKKRVKKKWDRDRWTAEGVRREGKEPWSGMPEVTVCTKAGRALKTSSRIHG